MFLRVTGPLALFARPEMRAERYSYDMIPPSAAQGLLKSIYWKPEMAYDLQKIHIYRKPKYEVIKTNDSSFKPMASQLFSGNLQRTGGSDYRLSRTAVVLRDVEYVLDFQIRLTGKAPESPENNVAKHTAIFCRRVQHGQYFRPPCLGAKEYPAEVELLDTLPENPVYARTGTIDLGSMFHHYTFTGGRPKPVFFHARLVDGTMDVTHLEPARPGWVFGDLLSQYDRMKERYDLPSFGYSQEAITFEMVLDEKGQIKAFQALREDQKPVLMTVPEAVKGRTNGIKANFLYDVPAYAIGYPGKGQDSREKFAAFGVKIRDVLGNGTFSAEERAMLSYIDQMPDAKWWMGKETLLDQSRKIVFRLEGKDTFIHENPQIKQKWDAWYESHLSGPEGICMMTGEKDHMAELQPFLVGVKDTKMNHAKLISIDKMNGKSFECYGAKGHLSESSPIGEHAAFQYAAMLNYYLSRPEHKVYVGDTTFVFWSREDTPELLAKIKYLLSGIREEKPEYVTAIPETFTILGLKPNATGGIRVGIRYYQTFQNDRCKEEIRDFARSIRKLYQDSGKRQDWEFIYQWEGEETMEQKEETRKDQAYLLGCLFAVLDKAQQDAIPSTRRNRTSLVYRYLEIAKQCPSRIMDRLVSRSFQHTKKVDYGMGRQRSELILELGTFPEPYPKYLTPSQQALFQLGYEQRRQSFFEGKKKEEEEADGKGA